MNASDIRLTNTMSQEACLKTTSVSAHEAGLDSIKISMLTEIAAQLAELNESRKPRWVWFGHNSHEYPIDASQVVALGVRSATQTYIYLRNCDDPWTTDDSVWAVCDKLGIAMPPTEKAEK